MNAVFESIPAVDLALAILLRRLGLQTFPKQLDLKRLNRLISPLALYSSGYLSREARN